ncbi:gluconokinase [Actinopolymorpha cephalotaxi]|uniref:Gluconokinase n=1 Tax=Actinopolymorpha cephalotaxi TaxID=504797 RepID=A0A1I3B3N0_9ACTN|nr:FGGY family carbohydrate kinase [Actinopolymorpha cephalotaxi]NYH81215.1 gluconokinase [Actinopolymorpha cephalotaxi]SFH56696.1 gluconokinase [Actinopolymorpha cephalotaxi]
MTARRLLALDLGSSSVRAVVCDERAEPLPGLLARRSVTARQDEDGRGELDPDGYLADLVSCLDELHTAGALDGVELVATSSQWHSVLAVGPDGTPVSAVLSWLDTRARPRPDRLPADPEAFHARTGAWVHPLYWTTKVPFLRERLHDRFGGRPLRFLGLPDYLRGVLLGTDATSVSMASGTGLLDVLAMTWDPEALALAEVTPAELPVVDDTPARLTTAWQDRWPALAGARWAPALGDGAASNLGSGCTDAGTVGVTVGTSAALRVVHGPDVPPPPATVWRYRVDADRLVSGIAFSGGGVLRAWVVRLLRLGADAEPTLAPGTSGLVCLPMHAGSRPPGTIPPGSGVVAGLSLETSPEELLAGTLEGVALESARALDTLEGSFGAELDVVLGGGAVHASPWWSRVFAATFDRPLRLAEDPEVGARGAAALALGIDLPPPKEQLVPDPEDVVRMAAARVRYDRLRNALAGELVRHRDGPAPAPDPT